ncbi:SDR family NAD(P)-dependent oxidoreductase [Amycolatopsis magusensis]|uniref:SDR family NAD(P)-dependent oxidoreductase n=1 Tax=Amycolatopsis magusensis TaxID=882444 RepID=UPI003C2D2FB8
MTGLALQGRVALVTGAAGGGCGSAVALRLAEQGATVVANGLPGHAGALGELAAGHPGIRPALADVGDERAVSALFAELADTTGHPGIVVHNAAPSLAPVTVSELETAQWRAELGTIIDGAFHLARAAAPAMTAAGWGRFVFVSSSAAFRGARGRSAAYAAGKAALHGLAVQLALELGPCGVTANVIAPSQIDTARARRGGRRDHGSMARSAGLVPLGRVGRPGDVAGLAAFLAGDESSYLTGQVIRLDGGSALAAPQTALKGAVR